MSAYGQIVIIKRTGEDGSCFPVLTKTCKIGRGNVCDIRVQRDGVSDEQCIIETRTDAQVWIRNLTHNQTLLNGVPISNEGAALKHKDIFVVSDRAFRWEYMPGSKFYCMIEDNSSQSVGAPSEVIKKDKIQKGAIKQVGSPALHTPGRKSNRRSIIETATNVGGWSVFDISDRSEKNPNADNVLQSPVNPTNNSTFDLIDFEDSVRSYLEEEFVGSAKKQRGSVNVLKKNLRKSNDRRYSSTPKLLKSAKKPGDSSSKMLENKNVLISASPLSSLEKSNLEVSDLTEDSYETLNDSVFKAKESGSFVDSPAVEENLTSHVTVGRTRGRRFSSDKIPFVTPALLKRPFNKSKCQSSNSVGSIIDSVNGNLVELENSVSCESRTAATDESSLISSNLSDTTGCGDESVNESQSHITSEEENEESMSRAFVNVRVTRRCKNSSSSPFVTPAVSKQLKRNVRRSSEVSGLSSGELKLSLNTFEDAGHNVMPGKSQCGTSIKIPAQSHHMAQDMKRSDGDHPIIVQSLPQSKALNSPTSVKSRKFHGKTPDKKFMGEEEDQKSAKSSRKSRRKADSQDEFTLALSTEDEVVSEEEVESFLSSSVASTANATNRTFQSVPSESFISIVTSSSPEDLASAEVGTSESREIVHNPSLDGSLECFGSNTKKKKLRGRKSGIESRGNISVSKDEIVENDKENLDELSLGLSSEEMEDISELSLTESSLLSSQRSTRSSLRKSLQNIPNQEVTDSVLENVNLMTPVSNITDLSVMDESVKSKRKTRKSVIEQENVPIITDVEEVYGKEVEKSIEEDRKNLSKSNILEVSTTSAAKSGKKTPKARKSLGDLSLTETNAVKSNRKSLRYSKSRGLDLDDSNGLGQSIMAFIQDGVSCSKTPITNIKEQRAENKSARSIRKTRQSEVALKDGVSIIGNRAGIVKIVDGIDSCGVSKEESSLVCNLSVSNKSSRTPGKIKLAKRISDLGTLSNQEEMDSCFEGLMGDLLKTPASKNTYESGKSSKKEKRSGMKSKNVSFNLDNTLISIKDPADEMASSLIEDECEESLIKSLDSSLTSFGKLRSSSGKCKGMHTFSSTPISNTSRKFNLSKNPTLGVDLKAVHSPITEEEAADIAVSPFEARSNNFDSLEESSNTIHEASESEKMPHDLESNVTTEVEEGTSSKSLLSALSSVKSNRRTPRSRKSETVDSLLASSSLGLSLNRSVSGSSYYEDAVSELVKIPSAHADKEVNENRKVNRKVAPSENSSVFEENVTGNSEERSSLLEEDTTLVELQVLDGSSMINSDKKILRNRLSASGGPNLDYSNQRHDRANLEDELKHLMKTPITIDVQENNKSLRSNKKKRDSKPGKTIDVLLAMENSVEDGSEDMNLAGIPQDNVCNESQIMQQTTSTPKLVKSIKKTPKQKKLCKDQVNDSSCLKEENNLLQTSVVKSAKSIQKARRSKLEFKVENMSPENNEVELQDNIEAMKESKDSLGNNESLSGPITANSIKRTPKPRNLETEHMDDSDCLEGVNDLMQTPAARSARSLRKTRRSELEGTLEDLHVEDSILALQGDSEYEHGTADDASQESLVISPSSFITASVKSVKKTPKQKKVDKKEINDSVCLEGIDNLMQTPAVKSAKSIRKTRKSEMENTMEDIQTETSSAELLTNINNEPGTADDKSHNLPVNTPSSCAPSSVKSVKKTPKHRKVKEVNDSICLEGVTYLMQTPGVNTTESTADVRDRTDEDDSAVEGIENESLIVHPPLSAPRSVKSIKKTPRLKKGERGQSNDSICLEGISNLMQTPAVKSARSVRKTRRSEMESMMEDSATEEVKNDEEHYPGSAADKSQDAPVSSPSFAPSTEKSVEKTPSVVKTEEEDMNVSDCLEGVNNMMKTPAVQPPRSMRKTRRSVMESSMEESHTEEINKEMKTDNGNEPVTADDISQESQISSPSLCAPSSVKSVKKTPKHKKVKEVNDSICLEGVTYLMQTPRVNTTKELCNTKQSGTVEKGEKLNFEDSSADVRDRTDEDASTVEEIENESLIVHPPLSAPRSVKSIKKTPRQRKREREQSNDSICLEGVSNLMQTPAVKSAGSVRKTRRSEMKSMMEDSSPEEITEEVKNDKENYPGSADISQEAPISSLVLCSPSIEKLVEKTSNRGKTVEEDLNVSDCLEGVNNLMKTPAVQPPRSVRKTRRSVNESSMEESQTEEISKDLKTDNDNEPDTADNIKQESPICSPSSCAPSSVNSGKKTPKHKKVKEVNDSICLEGVNNLMQSPGVNTTEVLINNKEYGDLRVDVNEKDINTEEKANESLIIQPLSSAPSSVKSIKKTPRQKKGDKEHANDSICLEGVSNLMQTPAVISARSLRKTRRSEMESMMEDSATEEITEEVKNEEENYPGSAADKSQDAPVSSPSLASTEKSVEKTPSVVKTEEEDMNVSDCLEGVNNMMKTPAVKSPRSVRKTRTSVMESSMEELRTEDVVGLLGDNESDLGTIDGVSQESIISSPKCTSSLVKSAKKTPKQLNRDSELVNESISLEGVSSMMQTPAVKSAEGLQKSRRSERNSRMEVTVTEDTVSELQGADGSDTFTGEYHGQESPISSSSLCAPTSVKSSKKTPKHKKVKEVNDSICLDGVNDLMKTPGVNTTESTADVRDRTDEDDIAVEEIDNESLIVHPPLSAPSSVKSMKKTPRQRKGEREQSNVSICLEGISNLMLTPTVKSAKSLRKTRRSGIKSTWSVENVTELQRISETVVHTVEIEDQDSVYSPSTWAPCSVKSIMKTPKLRKTEQQHMNESDILEGVSNLMQTPAVKCTRSIRKTRISRVECEVENSKFEDSIAEFQGDSKGDADTVDECQDDLINTPSTVSSSSKKSVKKVTKPSGLEIEQGNESSYLDGVSNLIQTPAVSRKSLRRSRSETESNMEELAAEGSIPDLRSIDENDLNESEEIYNESLIVHPPLSAPSSVKSFKKTPKNRKGEKEQINDSNLLDGITNLMQTPVIKSSKKKFNVSFAVEDISKEHIEVADEPYLCFIEEGEMVQSPATNVSSQELEKKTRKSNGRSGSLAFSSTPLVKPSKKSLSLSSNVENVVMMNSSDGDIISKPVGTELTEACNKNNESAVLGDIDCSWVTSSTFSFVRSPDSSKKKKKPENSAIGEKSHQSSDDKTLQADSSYEDVRGVKELMTRRSPLSRYSGFLGVKEMFIAKSPLCSYENVSGVKEIMRRKSPKSRYSDLQGVQRLFSAQSPVCNYENVSGVEDLFNVSSESSDKLMAVVNTSSEFSNKSPRKSTPNIHRMKALNSNAVVLLQRLNIQSLKQVLEKENLDIVNQESEQVEGGSNEEGADESSSRKSDTEDLSGKGRRALRRNRSTSDESVVDEESKSSKKSAKGKQQKSKTKEKDEKIEETKDTSSTERRALRRNRSTSLTVSEESEPLPKATTLSSTNSDKSVVAEESKSSNTNRRGRLKKSETEESDLKIEGKKDSSSTERRALRKNRSNSLTVAEESEPKATNLPSAFSEESVVAEENKLSKVNAKGKLQKSKTKENDLKFEVKESSTTERRALRRNRSNSLTVVEEGEPLPKTTTSTVSDGSVIAVESKPSKVNVKGKLQKSKAKESDLKLGEKDSSSTGRRALRRNRSTSLTLVGESEPLPTTVPSTISHESVVAEESKPSRVNAKSGQQKSKTKDKDMKHEETKDSSSAERRALRGKRSASLTGSEESEPLPTTTSLPSSISDESAVAEESKPRETNRRGRSQKSKTKESDLKEIEGKDSSSTGRRALRRNRSNSVPTEEDADKRVGEKAVVSDLDSGKLLNLPTKKNVTFELDVKKAEISGSDSGEVSTSRQKRTKSLAVSEKSEPLPKRTKKSSSVSDTSSEVIKSSQANESISVQKSKSTEKDLNSEGIEELPSTRRRGRVALRENKYTSVRKEPDAKEKVNKKMEISSVDSSDELSNLQPKTASLSESEETKPLSKKAKSSSISDTVSEESKSSQANGRSRQQKSKSKEKAQNLAGTEDSSSTSRRALRGNKSTSQTVTEEVEPIVEKAQTSSVSETINEESKPSQASGRGRTKQSKSKEKDLNLAQPEDSSSSSRRALRGNKSTSDTIETDAKKRLGKKVEVSGLVSSDESRSLQQKRTKCLSVPEESEPLPKRTKKSSSVSDTSSEEIKSSQAKESISVQKSKSKEKDLNPEVTEDLPSTRRRGRVALRENKSTSSAAVKEEEPKKNSSKRSKRTASPIVKENGENTDAKSAKTEDNDKIQVQKSKSNKKLVSESEGKRTTRKTSVDEESGDSKIKSLKKEIPLKKKGKEEKVVGRVTRGQKKGV